MVAPGFIDAHSHADGGLLTDPDAETQIRQGITTSVVGQDGGSHFPLASWFAEVEAKHVALNIASFVGHGTVRTEVTGKEYKRVTTPEEQRRMADLVTQEMQAGGLGLSSGLEYDPGFYSTTDELIACAKAAANVRADLKTRLERRGLTVLLATADEMRRDPSEAYTKRNASGWVLAEIRAEEDPDHAGDSRYSLVLDFHFPGTLASNVQKQMEILPSDSIEVSMSRLAIDAVLEIGAKARTGFAASNVDAPGVEIALEGVTAFTMITQVKSKLQAAMGNDFRVVEKRIERSRASLAVQTGVGVDPNGKSASIADQLRKMTFEGFTVQVTNVGDARIDVRLAPAVGKAAT